jgi:hypothetical protein
VEFPTGKIVNVFYNLIIYKIFLLATFQTVFLHYMIYGRNTYYGGVLASLDKCHNKTTFPFCLISLSVGANCKSFVNFSSGAWIRGSLPLRRLSTSVQLGPPSFGLFFLGNFLTNTSVTFLRNSRWEKIVSSPDYRFMLYKFFAYIYVGFNSYFLTKRWGKK